MDKKNNHAQDSRNHKKRRADIPDHFSQVAGEVLTDSERALAPTVPREHPQDCDWDPSMARIDGRRLEIVRPAHVLISRYEKIPDMVVGIRGDYNWQTRDLKSPSDEPFYRANIRGTRDNVLALAASILDSVNEHELPYLSVGWGLRSRSSALNRAMMMKRALAEKGIVEVPTERPALPVVQQAGQQGQARKRIMSSDEGPNKRQKREDGCYRCHRVGHTGDVCISPSQSLGSTRTCVFCPEERHILDYCSKLHRMPFAKEHVWHLTKVLLEARARAPQVRSEALSWMDFLDCYIDRKKIRPDALAARHLPWTNDFAKRVWAAASDAPMLRGKVHPRDFVYGKHTVDNLPIDPFWAGKTFSTVRNSIRNGELDGERHIGRVTAEKLKMTPRQDIIRPDIIRQLKSKGLMDRRGLIIEPRRLQLPEDDFFDDLPLPVLGEVIVVNRGPLHSLAQNHDWTASGSQFWMQLEFASFGDIACRSLGVRAEIPGLEDVISRVVERYRRGRLDFTKLSHEVEDGLSSVIADAHARQL